jgi:phage-related minor tail protein
VADEGTELGAAYLSILPDLSSLSAGVTKGMAKAGKEGGKAFQSGLDVKKSMTSAFTEAGKDAGAALARAAVAAAKSDVAKIAKQLTTATDKQADAAGRLRVAESKLADLRESGKAKASQLAAAEEAVEAARRKSTAATTAQESASASMAKAQDREKTATDELADAQKKAAKSAEDSGKKTGNRFTAALKKALGKTKTDSEDTGEDAGERYGVGFSRALPGVGGRVSAMFKTGLGTAAAVLSGAAAAAGFSASFSAALEQGAGNAKLTGQLGLTDAQSKQAGKVAGSLFTASYGESLGEVNDAIKAVVQNTGTTLGSLDLEPVTAKVLDLASTFDQDLGGVTRAVGQLIRTGLAKDATEALDIITVGFQKGADKSEDFLDTLNEYGTQFRKIGIDGATATGLISQGLRAGARDGDIVADSIKEFSIRAIDGSKTTSDGFKLIGLSAETMASQIAKGGKPAADGLQLTLDKLRGIKDPIKQSQAAVALFGTQAEDLGKALFALDPSTAVQGLGQVAGAADRLDKTVGTTPQAVLTGFFRTLKQGAVDSVGSAISAFQTGERTSKGFVGALERVGQGARGLFDLLIKGDFTGAFREAFNLEEDSGVVAFLLDIRSLAIGAFDALRSGLAGVVPVLGAFIGFIRNNQTTFGAIAVAVLAIVTAFKAYQLTLTIARGVTAAFTAVQTVLNAVMTANPIGLVVLALVGLVAGLIYAYKHSEKFRDIVNGVFGAVKGVVLTVVGALVTAFHAVVDAFRAVGSALATAFNAVKGAITTAVSAVVTAFNAVKTAVSVAVGFVASVWNGIIAAISGPVTAVVNVLQAIWSRVYPIIALPFYIAKALIENFWRGVQVTFTTVAGWVTGVFSKAWSAVSGVLSGPINTAKTWIGVAWAAIVAGFNAAKDWTIGAFSKAWNAVKAVLLWPVNQAKQGILVTWGVIKTGFVTVKDWVLGAFSKAWNGLTAKLTGPVNAAKTAITTAFGAAKGGLQWVFTQAVAGIGKIWDGLQELAKRPVRFIINTVMNDGLIDGFNWVAKKFQAPTIERIPLPKGFAHGGEFSGRLPGAPSAVDNMFGMSVAGPVGLATGEFITNAKDTARALPLLRHINGGGDLPFGFADGGLFGKLKGVASSAFSAGKSFGSDVLDVLRDPVKWFKDRLSGPLNRMSELGNSPMAEIVKQVPRNLVNTVAGKAKDLLGLGGDGGGGPINAGLAGVLQFVKSQVGKPYLWGGVGPRGYDCSGLVSAAINTAFGRNPYSRLGSTGSMPWSMFAPGPGAFSVGWFKGNPGHTAATVNGVNIESSGGRGVHMGPGARGASDRLFTNRMHVKGFAKGGLFGDPPFDLLSPRGKHYIGKDILPKPPVFDAGGILHTGLNLIDNQTGGPEELRPVDRDRPAVFELYGADKVLIGTMRGVARGVQTETAARYSHEFQVN